MARRAVPRAPEPAQGEARVLALDLGTSCGWAVLSANGGRLSSGTWDVSPRRGESAGMRPLRLRRHLRELAAAWEPALLAYELVERHRGTDAAHVYGELRGVLLEEGVLLGLPVSAHGVASIKSRATGRGNADKEQMCAAARARWGAPAEVPGDPEAGDDEADALWAAEVARAELPRQPSASRSDGSTR